MEFDAIKRILLTFFTSMIPVVELRGGIPLGVSMGLEPVQAMIICIIGNLLPVPFIILFIRKIFAWIRAHMPRLGKAVDAIERRAATKSEKVRSLQMLGLILFVAIPLPGTGAWTGALIAALLDMRLKKAMPAITLGILIAAVLITGLTYGFIGLIG